MAFVGPRFTSLDTVSTEAYLSGAVDFFLGARPEVVFFAAAIFFFEGGAVDDFGFFGGFDGPPSSSGTVCSSALRLAMLVFGLGIYCLDWYRG